MCQWTESPDTITHSSHITEAPTVEHSSPLVLLQLPDSPDWLMFHSLAICPNDIPQELSASLLSIFNRVVLIWVMCKLCCTNCHFLQDFLRDSLILFTSTFIYGTKFYLNYVFKLNMKSAYNSQETSFAVCVFFRRTVETQAFTCGVGKNNVCCVTASVVLWWSLISDTLNMPFSLEGQQPLIIVPSLWILVNRLSPRLSCSALPDVLAAHLHPRASSTPAGLLLVSRPRQTLNLGFTIRVLYRFKKPRKLDSQLS